MQSALSRLKRNPLRHWLASSTLLRSFVLPILRRMDRPITINNPYAQLPFRLLSYTHKGYWFYGKQREADTMRQLGRLTRKGDIVCEVGGHIGYLTQFFARTVGNAGQVHVFEPGKQNQLFLKKNIALCPKCVHINAAVSDTDGKATFYEENLGGFMNSLVPDFVASSNLAANQRQALRLNRREVNTVALDSYATAHNVWPQVVKIDVEGHELAVLKGAGKVLKAARAVMVEVARDSDEIFALLKAQDFTLILPDGTLISRADQLRGNIFGTRPDAMGSAPPATDQR